MPPARDPLEGSALAAAALVESAARAAPTPALHDLPLGALGATMDTDAPRAGSRWGALREAFSGSSSGDAGPAPPPALRVAAGATIKHYEVIRLLGRGGMGEVHLARDTRLGRLVALKFLSETSPERAARFIVEARATAQLTHENIVALHDIDEHEGMPYMVLEYVPGTSLRDRLDAREGRLRDEPAPAGEAALARRGAAISPLRAVELMLPVVRALARAHEAGVVHRDLKPANIMLAESGAVKVLDFGVAKLRGEAAVAAPLPDATRDATPEPSLPGKSPALTSCTRWCSAPTRSRRSRSPSSPPSPIARSPCRARARPAPSSASSAPSSTPACSSAARTA